MNSELNMLSQLTKARTDYLGLVERLNRTLAMLRQNARNCFDKALRAPNVEKANSLIQKGRDIEETISELERILR